MPETFLILLCGGVMLASAIPKPREVTLQWLRLCGIIAMTMLGLSCFFWTRRGAMDRVELSLYVVVLLMILLQLALVQTSRPVIARAFSLLTVLLAIPLAVRLLRTPENVPIGASVVGCAGV